MQATHTTQPAQGGSFADLEDDLDAAVAQPQGAEPQVYLDKCPKCNGTGSYGRYTRLGHSRCTACGGRGTIAFKTSPEERAARRASSANRREQQALDWEAAFTLEHPDVAAWWAGNTSDFAVAMREAVRKYGALTDRQLSAAYNCVERARAWQAQRAMEQAERAAAQAAAPVHNTAALEQAFATAKRSGLQRPALTIAGLRISEAPASGRNAGALYVKADGVYLGKVVGGKFLAGSDCDQPTHQQVDKVLANPLEEAIAHGKLTGQCAVCSRQLTDPVSVARGIGPVCAERFGW
jgi:hypothetical protein